MRISDWSADVCSSDLRHQNVIEIPAEMLGKTVTITFEAANGAGKLSDEVIAASGATAGDPANPDTRQDDTIVGQLFFLDALRLSAVPQGDPLMLDQAEAATPVGNSAELTAERLVALLDEAKRAWIESTLVHVTAEDLANIEIRVANLDRKSTSLNSSH